VLRSGDRKRAERALGALAKLPRDEDYADEISHIAEKYFATGDFSLKSDARACLQVWCTRENSAYFIKVLERHARTDARKASIDDQDFALEILTRLKDPDAVPAIARLLERFFDRDDAEKALLAYGPELAQAEVVKYANHKDPNVVLVARRILEQFKVPPAVMIDRNLADLKSPVADRRLWAAQALEKLDVDPKRRKEVAAALDPLLADRYGWPAHAAAAALIKWGTPENEPSLIKALHHASPDMRRLAANALARYGTSQSLSSLQEIVTKNDALTPAVTQAAKEAVAAIQGRK
jgi:HEAT repeat protein